MRTSVRGTFALSWNQVEIEGMVSGPVGAIAVGAVMRWHGEALRLDGPGDVLCLAHTTETADLHRHTARAVQRIVGDTATPEMRASSPEDAPLSQGFAVTDGMMRYTATLIEREGGAPLCIFTGALPPKGRDLWVSEVALGRTATLRRWSVSPEIICFTPETRIATPGGDREVGSLTEGDHVVTKDGDPQPVRWIGRRRLSGARLYTLPGLRPIRFRAAAMGIGCPERELLLSPQHRVVVKGPVAQSLYGEAEVLVAARDLVNDHSILVDRRIREVTYVHLLLDRHSIVFANGLEAETFHPATVGLSGIDAAQRARLEAEVPGVAQDPTVYGGFARRMLDSSEAEILKYAVARRPARTH